MWSAEVLALSLRPGFDAMLFAEAFVTLLVIMDPVGNVPVFLALTRSYDPELRRRAGLQATVVAAAVIVSFALFGELVLRLLGISIESLQVAGGLLLVLVALELLQPGRQSEQAPHPGTNAAFVPLGTPLLAGPGAIAAVMVYARQVDDVGEATAVVLALMAVLVVVYLALRYAAGLVGLLGENGIELLSKVVGLLLAAIAVQMVATGIESWVKHGVS